MAQSLRILFYLFRCSSQRIFWSVVRYLSDLTSARREQGPLWRHRTYSLLLASVLLSTAFADTAEDVRRFDNTRDGREDQWEYYRDGVLLRVEVDRNQDGRVDETTFYEQGKPVRAEFEPTATARSISVNSMMPMVT